ncbi:hypothetical protein NYE67_20720 [Solibacillus sp. FSL W8-0474]
MRINAKTWAQLTKAEKIKLLEIAVDQNWMGRLWGICTKKPAKCGVHLTD